MKKAIATILFAVVPLAASADDAGLVGRISPYPVAVTLDRLEAVLRSKSIKVFTRIDHAAEASSVGLTLRPMQLLVFGHPRVGTPLMQTAPTAGLDLPMKVLAWQDAQGQVQLTWSSPGHLTGRHGLDAEFNKNLAAVGGLIEAALK